MTDDATPDLTARILMKIQADIAAMRVDMERRFDTVDRRFEGVDRRFAEIRQYIHESELRTATAIHELADTTRNVLVSFGGRLTRVEQEVAEPKR